MLFGVFPSSSPAEDKSLDRMEHAKFANIVQADFKLDTAKKEKTE